MIRWGGAILAVPITIIVLSVLDTFEATRRLAGWLPSDRYRHYSLNNCSLILKELESKK